MPQTPFDREFLSWLERQENAVFLESARPDRANRRSYLFLDPVRTIEAETLDAVAPSLEAIAHATDEGLYAAGWIAYEAGCAFEETLRTVGNRARPPLLWMGLYRDPIVYDHLRGRFEQGEAPVGGPSSRTKCQTSLDPEPSLTESEYTRAARQVHRLIEAGETYQVNLTFTLRFPQACSEAELYHRLRRAQPVPYGAFLRACGRTILSFSPELFFRIDGRKIRLKPMKGTAARGRTPAEDRANRDWLAQSAKDHAENLMITDLLRNDVGRLAEIGSVKVPRFFDIERHPTLFQATSTVEATLRWDARIPDLVRCLFPSGSVTGAPKIRTMQIIRELEREPRGVYTGAIGFFGPNRRHVFNVAIRTLVLDAQGEGEMGVGSGLVADSDAESEFRECLLKGLFLEELPEDFELFETLLWERGRGLRAVRAHLARLRFSARHFGFVFSTGGARAELARLDHSASGATQRRVRLSLERGGALRVDAFDLEPLSEPVRVRISGVRTRSDDPYLFHKSTRRQLYDEQLRDAQAHGCFDVLFFNERGELTEGARSNVLVRNGSVFRTPPIGCGLLPGTFRTRLLARKTLDVREEVLLEEDLLRADAVYVCNALRGLVEVVLEP